MALNLTTRQFANRIVSYFVKVYHDTVDNSEVQVFAIHPDTTVDVSGSSVTATLSPTGLNAVTVKEGYKLFSDFPVLPATVTIVDPAVGTILAVSAQNTLDKRVELSFDGGTNWVKLNAKQNFAMEFADKAGKVSQGVLGRRSAAGALASGDIIMWATVV